MTKALQGYATRYNQILPLHHGEYKMILPDAFDRTLKSGSTVKLLINHHDDDVVATTDDRLQLFSDQYGLGFRCNGFPDTEVGNRARSMAESRTSSNGMSVGFNYDGALKERRMIDGKNVVVIVRAWLNEISFLLVTGAVVQAFASYVDIDGISLRDDCESLKILSDGAFVGVRRALNDLQSLTSFG